MKAFVFPGAVVGLLSSIVSAETLDLTNTGCFASSHEQVSPPHLVQHAFDNNPGTRWSSDFVREAWIVVDLGREYHLKRIAIDWELARSAEYTIRVRPEGEFLTTWPRDYNEVASVLLSGISWDQWATGPDEVIDFSEGTFTLPTNRMGSPSVEFSALKEPRARYVMLASTMRGDTRWGISIWQMTIEVLDPVEEWRKTWFGQSANAGLAADDATPLGDGTPNLLKYALGLNPGQPALAGLPECGWRDGGFALSFVRHRACTDITYRVEAVSQLGGQWSEIWSSRDVPYGGGEAEREIVTVRDPVPAGEAPGGSRFLRLRVTRP